jgi:hypothetical protein
MAKRGRPKVLDEGMQKMVVGLVVAGCSQREAARHAGCAASTISMAAREDPAFGERLRLARREKQLSRLARWRSLSRRSWRAAAWFLERQCPDSFGQRMPKTVPIRRVSILMVRMVQLIADEVPDLNQRKRILAGLAKLAAHLAYPQPSPKEHSITVPEIPGVVGMRERLNER